MDSKRQSCRVALACLVILLLVGCASQNASLTPSPGDSLKVQAWKALTVGKQVYDATFKTLALLDSQGKLPAETKAKCISLGNQYLKIHNLAVQALLDNGQPSLAGVQAALDAFLTVAAPYTVGGK